MDQIHLMDDDDIHRFFLLAALQAECHLDTLSLRDDMVVVLDRGKVILEISRDTLTTTTIKQLGKMLVEGRKA